MFEWLESKEQERERHEKAFKEGVEEGKNGGLVDDLFHDLDDVINTVNPLQSTEHQSRQTGYCAGKERRSR